MRIPLSALPPSLRAQAEAQLGLSPRPASPHMPLKTPQKPASTPSDPPPAPSPSKTPTPAPKPRKPASPADLAPYPPPASRSAPPTRDSADSSMTQTERLYLSAVLNNSARFEPVTFRLLGGCRYTPDFLTIDDGVLTFHEVKGSYRLESEGRAWTAFNEAAALFPCFRWIWAVRNKKGAASPFSVKTLINPLPTLPIAQTTAATSTTSASGKDA